MRSKSARLTVFGFFGIPPHPGPAGPLSPRGEGFGVFNRPKPLAHDLAAVDDGYKRVVVQAAHIQAQLPRLARVNTVVSTHFIVGVRTSGSIVADRCRSFTIKSRTGVGFDVTIVQTSRMSDTLNRAVSDGAL